MKININRKAGAALLPLCLFTFLPLLSSCSDDDDYSVSTTPVVTSVTTGDAMVTATAADIPNGTVQSLKTANAASYEVGVVYSTSADPTNGGTRVAGTWSNDTISTRLTGLTTGTTYHYASYVRLQNRVYRYGEVKTFTATQIVATNNDATNVSYTQATFSPSFSGLDGVADYSTGLKIGRGSNPETLMQGRDYQAGTVGGLLPGTTYYYMPYVKVGDGYVLGEVKSLTTREQTMEYVDLGLSVMWAKYNVGAETEEGFGTYFGYGDQTGEQLSTDLIDYPSSDISDTELDITNGFSIDGASKQLSSMPTLAQVQELVSNTTQTAATVNGVPGVRFTAPNSNSIFLPAAGYRNGKAVVSNGTGAYWTGTVSAVNGSYANTLAFTADGTATNGNTLRYYGIPLRTVRGYGELKPNTTGRLAIGDIEGNGRIRIEIYNEYGATKGNSVISPASVKFSESMSVTFRISGLDGNYKDGAARRNIAGLEYADASWSPSHWSSFTGDKYDAVVTGDGTYTVWMETGGSQAEGAVVFCVDINNLANDLVDPSKVTAEIVSIKFDAE